MEYIYRRKTHTDMYLHARVYITTHDKRGLLSPHFYEELTKKCNVMNKHQELQCLKEALQKNLYAVKYV